MTKVFQPGQLATTSVPASASNVVVGEYVPRAESSQVALWFLSTRSGDLNFYRDSGSMGEQLISGGFSPQAITANVLLSVSLVAPLGNATLRIKFNNGTALVAIVKAEATDDGGG